MIVPIVYSENQIIRDRTLPPGAFKARDVFKLVERETGLHVHDFFPVTEEHLWLVHDKDFVTQVLRGETLNGFRTRELSHIVSIRYVVGNLLQAVTLTNPPNNFKAVFSLTNGFHHAGYDFCYGYCTFNALSLAAVNFYNEGGGRVLILDGDAHLGDGCIDIRNKLESAHESHDYLHIGTKQGWDNQKEEIINQLEVGEDYSLVIYQAGADSFIQDNLGAGTFTKQEFEQRDRDVFEACKVSDTPVVFNLAGGYGAPDYNHTLMLHYNTWQTANRVFNGWD